MALPMLAVPRFLSTRQRRYNRLMHDARTPVPRYAPDTLATAYSWKPIYGSPEYTSATRYADSALCQHRVPCAMCRAHPKAV